MQYTNAYSVYECKYLYHREGVLSFAQSDAGKVSTSYIPLYLPTDVSATLRSGLFVSKQKFLPKESDSMASLQAPGKSLPAQLTQPGILAAQALGRVPGRARNPLFDTL